MPMQSTGVEAEIARFMRAEKQVEPAIKKAVKAGGKYLAEKLSEAAPKREGHLSKSIKPGPVKYSVTEGFHVEVKPTGNHPQTGEPLAKIGNILEYGRSYGKTEKAPMAWFQPTVLAEEGAAEAVMAEVFTKEQAKL